MIQFSVPDMECGGCVQAVAGAVRRLDAAATVQADLPGRRVGVETTRGADEVAAAIRAAGFTVEPA